MRYWAEIWLRRANLTGPWDTRMKGSRVRVRASAVVCRSVEVEGGPDCVAEDCLLRIEQDTDLRSQGVLRDRGDGVAAYDRWLRKTVGRIASYRGGESADGR